MACLSGAARTVPLPSPGLVGAALAYYVENTQNQQEAALHDSSTGLRHVIIGNGAAGTNCAETLRKLDPSSQVTVIGGEPYPLYNRVALPPFLKGKALERKVIMRS